MSALCGPEPDPGVTRTVQTTPNITSRTLGYHFRCKTPSRAGERRTARMRPRRNVDPGEPGPTSTALKVRGDQEADGAGEGDAVGAGVSVAEGAGEADGEAEGPALSEGLADGGGTYVPAGKATVGTEDAAGVPSNICRAVL